MADSQTQEPNETQLEPQAEQVKSTEQNDALEEPAIPNESQAINDVVGAEDEAANTPSEDVGETKAKEEMDTKKKKKLDEDDDDDDDDEDSLNIDKNADPNVMPQVNVSLLAKRKWQVKVYPLKAGNFTSGQITSVFKSAKESLLYIVAMNKYASGKGEMFASSAKQAIRVVHNLMKLEFLYYPEINIEIIKKNNEGAVEQKALLRFDPKLVRMLCIPPIPRMHGKKRNRLIGSVFVKNLPCDTSKEMLRVLFPFAAEINYTPDKFKDGTARLVLENRSSVFHCLKAFTKVELGGNILEFHPLEKRREQLRESDSKTTRKEQVVGVKVEIEEDKNKEADSKDLVDANITEESKEKTLNTETTATASKSPQKGPSSQKEPPKKTSTTSKNDGAPMEFKREFRGRGRGTWFSRRRDQGPINSYQEKKKVGGPPGKPVLRKPEVSSHARAGRPDIRKGPLGWDSAGNRSPIRQNQNRGNRGGSGNRNNRNNSVWNSRASGGRNSFSSGGGYATSGRANRRFEQQSFSGGDMGINAEATKEMMLLQSQLSVAIKNQIAMLNQTQLAVEQAKRGAGMGLTSDLAQASSSGEGSRAFGAGTKRRAHQSGFSSDYGDDSFSGKRQNLGLGSQQRSWAEESPADYYGMQQSQTSLDYGIDRQTEDTTTAYGNSYNSRNLSQSNVGYDQSSYRYHY